MESNHQEVANDFSLSLFSVSWIELGTDITFFSAPERGGSTVVILARNN